MLNEKEKKAVERLKERINDNEDYKTVQVWLTADIVAVNTLLNLITKLKKENEEKDKQIDLMALAILNYDDQLVINRYKNIDEVKETFEKLAKEKGE